MHGQRSRALPPATSCASGRSGLRQAHISSSTRKRSGLGMPAPSEVDFRTVSSDASCRFAVSGCRSECKTTYKSRNQSREAGTSSRILTAWKLLPNISGWVLQTIEKGHQYSLGLAPQVYMGVFHRGGPPAGSGNRIRSESSVRERGHRICSSLKQGNWALQPVFHSSKEGWGLCPILDLYVLNDSVVQLKFKMLTLRQIVPQVRSEDWFVTIDLKDAYFHISILPYHKKFLRVRFWGQSIPISGSSVWPSIITPYFHEICRCGPEASLSSGYSHNELLRILVYSSSVASVDSSESRCRSCPHERFGFTAIRQKECAFWNISIDR